MDKYEFNIKVEKMKKAVDRKDYATAARVADSLGWERSTNAKVLMMIAQIYEKQERYIDARNALTAVYNRVPVGKRIVYKLAELAVKCGDVQEALDLYKEYQEMAPNDPTKLILAYKISTARGDDLEKRISILEAYRRRDFDEKWAYELATLYQQAGRGSDCVVLCDEIILWFGVGPYVDKAMTLKVAYEPLTPEQEEKRANKDYYEQRLAEVAAASIQIIRPETDSSEDASGVIDEDDDSDDIDEMSDDHSENIPGVSPVVKEADLHLTMQQELAQAIQSTSEELTPETTVNEWITDKPLSVDRVGEDIDGQYTLFQTASEEIGEPHVPEHTRTFSFGALLSKTRRLDSLRDLAELNSAQMAEETEDEEAVAEETPVEETVLEESVIEKTVVETAEMDYDELAEAFEAAVAEEAEALDDAVAEETLVWESIAEETVAEETVPDETVLEEAVVEEIAAEETIVEETVVEEIAAEETAVEEAVVEEPAVEEAVAEETVTEETASEETVTETAAPEVVTKPQHMIFCHVLKLNDESSTVAQIKDSIRQAHEVSGIPAASIARIGVDKINRVGFSAVLTKLQGRDLLLEHAGELAQKAIDQLIAAVEEPPCTTVILLADDAAGVSELYRKAPALFPLSAMENIEEEMVEESPVEEDDISFDLDSFLKSEAQIVATEAADESDLPGSTFEEPAQTEDVPYSNRAQALSPNEFIRFIVEYSLENDCKFDSMAELALAAHIDRMELNRVPLNRDTAMELADRIIDRADHWTLKCLFVSRYDKEGYLIIKESHIH